MDRAMQIKTGPDLIDDAMISGGKLSSYLQTLASSGVDLNSPKQPHPTQAQVRNYQVNPTGVPVGLNTPGRQEPGTPQQAPSSSGVDMPLFSKLQRFAEFISGLLT